MARSDAPISSTLCRSSTPLSASSTARFSAVCPPTVGSSACGFSFAMIFSSDFARERFDVSALGQFGIGHDRRRIRIDQNDFGSPPRASALQACEPE
jgi:hypothetical protein